jgi:hypothetical protein
MQRGCSVISAKCDTRKLKRAECVNQDRRKVRGVDAGIAEDNIVLEHLRYIVLTPFRFLLAPPLAPLFIPDREQGLGVLVGEEEDQEHACGLPQGYRGDANR